jgi:hypothetical protein
MLREQIESKKQQRTDRQMDRMRNADVDRRLLVAGGLTLLVGTALGAYSSTPAASGEPKPPVQLFKNPQCSCCEGYAAYLRQHGYSVTTTPTHDLTIIRRQHGVPESLAGCHTMIIGDYVVEGHVPIGALNKLLSERPKIRGISLPGMPEGSPGMTGRKTEPFTIYEITDGEEKVYAVE